MPLGAAQTQSDNSPAAQQISSPARLISTLYSPGRTFADIARAPHFILCWVVQAVIAFAAVMYELNRVGPLAMARQAILQNASGRALDPAQLQQRAQATAGVMKFSFYASPLFTFFFLLVFAGIFFGAVNFIFGREARFKQVLAVVSHALLPLTVFYLVTIVVLRFTDPANFLFANPVGSNPGFFMDQATTSPSLYTLASHLDIFAFWCVALISIGLSKLGKGIKFGSAFGLTFGLWLLFIVAAAGLAAI